METQAEIYSICKIHLCEKFLSNFKIAIKKKDESKKEKRSHTMVQTVSFQRFKDDPTFANQCNSMYNYN